MKTKTRFCVLLISLLSFGVLADFTCPDGTEAACLESGDSVCPEYAKCVEADVVCLEKDSCDSERGFICGADYDVMLGDFEETVEQYNQLIIENVDLRAKALEQRNCVINAQSVKAAIQCVR